MVHVNGKKVGGNANVCKFTAYVSPYFVVSNGGAYTKHIYAASQRIASKLGNIDGFGADPRRVEQAGGLKKTDNLATTIKARYESLGIGYEEAKKEEVLPDSTMDSEEPENLVFYYHPDHLGSTSYVTDADGNIAQHVEYIPYGEVFVEERNSQFSTNYLFNAKELDNETGLYYYGARYLDPTGAMWLSVDPMWEKNIDANPYNYCHGNPVVLVDPDGNTDFEVDQEGYIKVFDPSTTDDRLFTVNANGEKQSIPLSQSQYDVVSDLIGTKNDMWADDLDQRFAYQEEQQIDRHYASYSIANNKDISQEEMSELYKFLADASCKAEWRLSEYQNGDYVISTAHQDNISPSFKIGPNAKKYSDYYMVINIHSHPSENSGTKGPSLGDKPGIVNFHKLWMTKKPDDAPKNFPMHYVYHRASGKLYPYKHDKFDFPGMNLSKNNLLKKCRSVK